MVKRGGTQSTIPSALGQGRYVLRAELHLGQPVSTYRGYDHTEQQERLVWVVPITRLGGRGAPLRRFQAVVQGLATVRHPHLLSTLDTGVQGEFAWIVAEGTRGVPLEDRIAGPVPPMVACELVLGILDALQVAHDQGVFHTALSSRNVWMADGDVVRLAGVGFASAPGGLVASDAPYRAPELDEGRLGPEADLWSAGMLLAHLLGGRLPGLEPEVPGILGSVVGRALSRDPGARPSLGAWSEEIREAMKALIGDKQHLGLPNPLTRSMIQDETPLDLERTVHERPRAPQRASEETVVLAPDTRVSSRRFARQTYQPGSAAPPASPPAEPGSRRWLAVPLVALLGLGGTVGAGLGWAWLSRAPQDAGLSDGDRGATLDQVQLGGQDPIEPPDVVIPEPEPEVLPPPRPSATPSVDPPPPLEAAEASETAAPASPLGALTDEQIEQLLRVTLDALPPEPVPGAVPGGVALPPGATDLGEPQTGWAVRSTENGVWHRAEIASIEGPAGRGPRGATLQIACASGWVDIFVFATLASYDDAERDAQLLIDGAVHKVGFVIDPAEQRLILRKAKKTVQDLKGAKRLDVFSWYLNERSASFDLNGIDGVLRQLGPVCGL